MRYVGLRRRRRSSRSPYVQSFMRRAFRRARSTTTSRASTTSCFGIAHFAVGWFAFPLSELYWRKGYVRRRILAAFFAVMTSIAMAGLWEIVEWLYAVIDGDEAGAAFLGSQGDEWDAQKDILCDAFGAVCSSTLFLSCNRNEPGNCRCIST